MVPVQSWPKTPSLAFKQNDPQKRIAALELYGTLFLALLLMAQNPSTSCRLHIPLISDNQGNVYSILTMLPERCQLLWSWWSSSTNFTKLGICWLLPIHVEMTINGLMSWRILNLKALIQWILRPTSINLLWFQKFWKLAILLCGKTTWTPTCDLFWGRVGFGSRTRQAPPCGSRWRCHGGEDMDWSFSF